ncbi:MAG: tetratricopeptide repeat protein [Deltaproteobacteria bacterium]|nr:tetratricopeptide repeat protein [Deltaproteobacteria bacterium]
MTLAERLLAEGSRGSRDEAERLLERALLIDPTEPRGADALRRILTASGRSNDWRALRARLVRVKACPPSLVLEHAQDLLTHKLYQETRDLLVARRDLTKKAADLLMVLASAYEGLSQSAEAAATLTRAANRLDRGENADSLRLRAARLFVDANDARAAIRLLAYVDSPRLKSLAMAERGDAYRKIGEWRAAAAEYREALRGEPTNGGWYAALADALGKSGDTKGMRAALLAAQRAGTDSTNIRLTIGQEALRSGDADRAIDVFRKAALADPKSVDAATLLAYALESRGRTREAEESYRRAIASGAAAKDARVNLAILLGKRGDFAAQRSVIEEGLNAGDSGRLRFLLGASFIADGQRERAREEFARAARLDEKDPKPIIEMARLDQAAGKNDEARRHWDEALKRNPRAPDALTGKASSLENDGEREQAVRLYREALAADPHQSFARERLIKLLEAMKEPDEAAKLREAAEKLQAPR